MSSEPEAIGLLGGTFDPVHNGHLAIVDSYLNSGLLDRLFLVLTPEPPHKENQELSSYEDRKKMLQLAFEGVDNLSISTIENKLPKPSYSINTVDHFKKAYPDSKLYLCIGEDSLLNFKDWYRWKAIVKKCTLLVAKRPTKNNTLSMPDDLKAHLQFIDHEQIAVSSSEIRKKIKQGEQINHMLPPKVLGYIEKHKLYDN